MATLQRTGAMFLFFVFLGGISGGILAEILRRISSPGFVHNIFLKGFNIGLNPPVTVDLHMISFTLGFTLQINLLTVLGVILGLYTYRQA